MTSSWAEGFGRRRLDAALQTQTGKGKAVSSDRTPKDGLSAGYDFV